MTLASWANTIVICALGLGLGATLFLTQRFTPSAFLAMAESKREREGSFRGAAIGREELSYLRRDRDAHPWRIATMAWLGLIAVLVLTLWLSPIQLGWWTLLLSVIAGTVLMEFVFRLARGGRLRVGGSSRLDPLAGVGVFPERAPAER